MTVSVRRLAGIAMTAVAMGVGSGCGPLLDAPPADPPASVAPRVDPDVDAANGIVHVRVPRLARDSAERRAAQITVRVRNLTCDGLGTGSGFAIDSSTLITNRHVVEGAQRLEVNLSDGRTLTVSTAEVGVLGDVAFVMVDATLPVIADLGGRAAPGSEVTAVGYPLGGRLTISPGTLVDRIDGYEFAVPGTIVRTTAEVEPGNSGGPLLDAQGRVAGVIYAIEIDTGLGLAIPMSTVDRLLESGGTQPVTDCREY
jgi:S1-C subfamily serine protease